MTLNTDISTALHLLEHVHKRVEDCDDPKLQLHTSQDLQSLISLLEDPVFRSIVTIQDSLAELNNQLGQHPSILPGDFEINLGGQLQFSVPNTPIQPVGQAMYQNLYQDSNEIEDQRVPVASLIHTSNEDTTAQVASPSLTSDVIGMPPIMTPTYAKEFQKVIEAAAKGRQIFTVQLFKSEGTSLGFSVVGLRSKDRGELGIFLQEIQPNGIAGSDGRLLEGDQILAIDGQPLDSNISHEQAISILQKARGLVELIVARSAQDIGSSVATDELPGVPVSSAAAAAVGAGAGGGGGGGVVVVAAGGSPASAVLVGAPDKEAHQSLAGPGVKLLAAAHQSAPPPAASAPAPTPLVAASAQPQPQPQQPSGAQAQAPPGGLVERSNSAVSDASKSGDMVLNTEWAQVEVINLINDGSGLGFGIIGGRSTGVVVKTILPGGVADRDNRLQSGDHILQIGEVNLRGMGSEQVAAVLRQSGTHVRLVVARPVEPTSPDYQALGGHAPIVPTKILGDPDELDRYLLRSGADAHNQRRAQGDAGYENGGIYGPDSELDVHGRASLVVDGTRNSMPLVGSSLPIADHLPVLSMDPLDVNALPEMERFNVELKKDSCGLGITIAGYVCEKEELSGIFVKSISEGSAADLSKKIQINDRIVEVNGHSLQGYSNHEAVEVLRSTGQTVTLCLERYLRGPKYEQLQQAIAASELKLPQPSSPSITSLPTFPISADDTTLEIEPEGESHTTVDSAVLQEIDRDALMGSLDEISNVEALLSDPSTEMTPNIEAAIKVKWQKIVGPDIEIVVAQLKKFAEGSGLGISLEGTVDVENGQEVRPHHYIRSILPEGPVGQNGILRSGDELLEVNGYRLLGINHMEVVSVLKELPIHVRMVCGRNIASQDLLCPIDTAQHQAAFQTRSILGGSLQNLLPTSDRLVKAKSDGSLASTTTTATVTDASLNKMKSRSLEPLTGLAMWSSEPQIIELIKGERGLGFSILDYQDPMNPNETVIVIRSLVPGGVAQVDGQLIPGDRLLFVNDIALENATLDQAVQALKGAPKGIVRIGVAKPLPIPDSIAQRLAPICIVRRSKSLPDSEAAVSRVAAARAVGAGVHLDDFLSPGTGLLEDAGVAAVEERRSAERRPAQVQDSGLLGLARRKDEAASFEPHSPLIKLTPFLEEQRRALLSGVPEAEATENGVDDFDSARLLDAGATPPKRRRSTPCGEPSGGGGGGGGSSSSIGSSISSIGLLRKRSYGPGAESASLGSAFRAPLRPQRGVLVAEDGPRPTSAGQSSSDGEAGPETTEPTAPETRSLAAAGALLAPEAGAAVSGRRSSLRRRRRREDRGDEPGAQEEPGPEAPAAEPVKKTVRISSVEEEIRIESLDLVDQDELGGFGQQQEVRLVTARILGAEELATNGDGRPSGREEDLGRWTSRLRQFTDRPEDAAEDDEEAGPMAPQRAEPDSRLRPPPCLKPSASETALSRERRPDDNRISEKNLGPEIVMDLSRVTGDEEESESAARSAERVALDEDGRLLAATPSRAKRKLGRVSSDGAQLQAELVRFHLGGGSSPDEERTGRPCVGATERETTAPSTTERTVEATVAEEAVEGDGLARRQGRPVDEPRPTSRRGSSEASALGEEGEETEAEEEEEEAAADRARGLDEAPKEEPPPAPPDDEPDDVFEEARDESFASPATSAASRLSAERGRSPPPPLLVRQGRALGSPAPSEDLLGTDCSSPAALEDLEPESLDCSSTQSLLSASCRSFGSPRREAETQTQGEHKSTQYELEDLAELLCELYDRAAERPRERLGRLLEARFGSPRREAEVQTELESKAVQCVSEELAASGDFGPFRRPGRDWRASPRREAQVQTGQEAKSTQCRLGELAGEEERLRDEDDDDGDYGPPGQETICSRSPPLASAAASAAAAAAAAAGPATECPAARPGSPESSSPPPSGTASPSVSSSPRPGEESSSSSPPLILLVKGDPATVDMTVTHRDRDGNVVWAKHWGPERLVEIYREHQTSLGLSIVGGKVDLHDTGNSSKSPNVSGIFIKNVLPNSPAGRAGGLQTGDRIIEVDGVDLRNSTHERAVKAIQAAGNPVRLLVQSLVHLSPENNEEQDGEEASTGGGHRSGERSQGPRTSSVVRRRHDSPMKAGAEAIQEGRPDLKRQSSGATSDAAGPSGRRSSMKKSLRRKAPSPSPGGGAGGGALRELSEEPDEGPKSVGPTEPKNKYSSGESSEEEEDARELEGNVYTKNGVEISRKSAGNVKRSKEEIAADPEEEDDFGYTTNKVKKRYANLKEPVFLFKLDRERSGLGISLAGHKDRNKMSVFVCGLNPSGAAFKKGEIKIGDELLEVNGTVFQGRCHLNASSMIKGMPSISYKLVVVRRRSGIDNCAVKQVLHFPTALPGEDFSQYKGVRTVPIKKGTYGLGIMIIEGKHAEVGQGIFVSDIQEGGAAELAGLMVGDMILSVNADAVTGSTYDEAATLLKKAEGIVTLTVCNPNQSKVAEDEERLARGEPIEPAKDLKLEPEKPKEPEPPADPKTGKIVPHKDTTIEFPKDKDKPIGFSVVGGTDTPSKSVFVLDVFTDGAAGKDSRLQPGDRIVEINKESFKAMEQEKAYQTVLRITQGPIIMIVHRDEKAVEEIEVELTKKSGKGSGLVLMGYKSGKGAYVSEVVAGGSAAESGKISKGDRVVAIGGQDLREAPVEDIALHVKVSNPLQLKLARYKTK